MSDSHNWSRGETREGISANAGAAPKGCCQVITRDNAEWHENVTSEKCDQLAEEAGGRGVWKPGPCR